VIPFDQQMLDDYAKVVDDMLAARNLLVRISITGEIEKGSRIAEYLTSAKDKETIILGKVIELL
jgi:hypothetical protein